MNDALDLIVENMQETPTNCKKNFALWVKGLLDDPFTRQLLDIWAGASGENQRRLAIAYPQLAEAALEYNSLPLKKREKYINKLLNIKETK